MRTAPRQRRQRAPAPGGAVVDRYDALLLDLDGVLHRGGQPVPGAAEALEELRRRGLPLAFLTNNSSRTPEEVAARLAGMGFRVRPDEVVTSAQVTAALLRREGAEGRTAFVLGERGLRQALRDAGLRILDGEPERADLVVVGWDRSATYDRLRRAALLVQRGARLVASNADAAYPAPDGLWPGAGALLAAITTTTGARATVVGKPAPPMFEAARERTGARRPLVVGDRLDSDVAGSAAMGWDSALLLTGVSRPADLLRAPALPTYVAPGLSVLLDDVPPARCRPAVPDDVPALNRLLRACGLSAEGLEGRLEGTVVLEAEPGGGELLATACVEDFGPAGLLRSVGVRPEWRGKGLGLLAVAGAVAGARARGVRHLSLFTRTAAPFFGRLGFRPCRLEALPEPVRTSPQARGECASSTPMVLELDGPGPSPDA
ncbi:MAG TPA: HAD-IIA family hydrolase [Actinomycetota bacterium]|nr:HAD-IIA family hydrolase [Actinomycetota bacterium]